MIRKDDAIARLQPLARPVWLPEQVWPFKTWGRDIDGSQIAITDVGQGPVLLFVHTGLWSFVWRDVIQRLSPDFRCVCFDAPGTGQSSRLQSRRISLDRAARAVTAVIETMQLDEITLVLHDLGGPSGIAGAARFADRIRGLCAVNTFAWKPSGAAFRGMLTVVGSTCVREFDVATGLIPRITASPFGVGRHFDQSSRAAFLAGIGRQGIRAFHSYLRDARKSTAIYRQLDAVLTGPFSKLPMVTIFGERNDPLGFQPRRKALFPEARQVVVSQGNHFPMCDDPELVASTIREFHYRKVAPTIGGRSIDSVERPRQLQA